MTATVMTACSGGTGSAGSTAGSGSARTQSGQPADAARTAASAARSLTATEADFSISLNEDHLTAGTYTITVVNDGHSTHDLAVEEDGATKGTSDPIRPGGSTTLTVDLDAGQYVFYCSIGNHRTMGMELTVTVA
jgi:plastocyanin